MAFFQNLYRGVASLAYAAFGQPANSRSTRFSQLAHVGVKKCPLKTLDSACMTVYIEWRPTENHLIALGLLGLKGFVSSSICGG
jgi:hypothetical protein